MLAHIESWISQCRETGKSENTCSSYHARLEVFSRWFEEANGEPLTPQNITSIDLREFRQHLLDAHRKAATINASISAIKDWLRFYSRDDVRLPAAVERQTLAPKALTKQEEHALMRAVERGRDYAVRRRDMALILLMLRSGLRISEVADLRIEDLTLGDRSGEMRVLGKGSKERIVPLTADVRRVLREYLGERKRGAVFFGQRGEMKVIGLHQVLKKYAHQAKIPCLHAHILRHTFARRLLDAGADLETVSALLGHESLATTQIYTVPSLADMRRAVERLSDE